LTADPFTLKRLVRFAESFRERTATLPTLKDFEADGFDKALVDGAVKKGLLAELYVTLTSGAVVKGYKKKS
jgi:hypothetical protein